MHLELRDECEELKEILKELKKYGSIGLKMSTEDSGNSLEFIDFVNNRLLDDILPLSMKIGGPDAQNDIREALKIGVSGIIGPMIESPFGIQKFITALRGIAGDEAMKHLLVSVNIESVAAYRQIDEILKAPEIKDINEIVIGTSDLCISVGKPKEDPEVIKMVREMAQKSKRASKIVRIGGMISLSNENPPLLKRLLEETGADEVNTTCVSFSVKKTPDLCSAYLKALNFEMKLYAFGLALSNKRAAPLQRSLLSLEKTIGRIVT